MGANLSYAWASMSINSYIFTAAPGEWKVIAIILLFQMGKLDREQTILVCLAWGDLGEAGGKAS